MTISKVISHAKIDLDRLAIGSPAGAYVFSAQGGKLIDITTNSNDGVYKGPRAVHNRARSFTHFNGTDYIDMSGLSGLNMGTGDYTMILVARSQTTGATQDVMSSFSNNKLVGLQYTAAGVFRIATIDFSAPFTQVDTIGTSVVANDNCWHIFIATIDRDVATGQKLYIDGIEETYGTQDDITGVSGDNFTSFNSSANIGASTTPSNFFTGDIAYFAIYNRVIRDDEIAKIVREFNNTSYFKAEYGINATNNVQDSTNIENSPIRNIGGAALANCKVTTDTINGTTVKILESVTNTSQIALPVKAFAGDENDAAFGEWGCWMYAATGQTVVFQFIDNTDGEYYNVAIDGVNARLQSRETGSVSKFTGNNSSVTLDAWHKIQVKRNSAGTFSVYLDNNLFSDIASGTNPFTDTTTKTSDRIQLQIGPGCKIAWADTKGLYSMYKK